MGNILVKSAVLDVGIQWALFVVAAALKTEKFYDLAGSSTFLLLAIQSLRWGNGFFLRQRVQTGMVVTWATRLGFYLFSRILQDGGDKRFDKVRNVPSTFFVYWTIQAVWVFVTLLPTLILNSKKSDQELTKRDYAGWTLWAIGFVFEALADHQKSVFRANPENAGRFIQSGLWGISRHPNYFGEILMWLGMYLSASTTFRGWEHLGVISPIFVTYLLTKVSGIPLLERMAMQRWGDNPLHAEYVRNTAVLVPFIY
ncbi:hypothetical protein CAPTEDRAFT_113160 [Capitella teleta]|uniref:Uncharacterized protein n=1 Tax=Capitella teleta TaxID=283909 RepID=R7T915_CAPTE|nr:hypothetical protein CAPTEDRAFT_113160 [Capitella teleta]|eukprot:ELT87489.1 hypothetical protein CAPTEDRAFT_113160 [Capitella teleta]